MVWTKDKESVYSIRVAIDYVHTVTFSHGFVLFHNPKGVPIYFQTIENDAKTLPCAHSLSGTHRPRVKKIFFIVALMGRDQKFKKKM